MNVHKEKIESVTEPHLGSIEEALLTFEVDIELWLDVEGALDWLEAFAMTRELDIPGLGDEEVDSDSCDGDDHDRGITIEAEAGSYHSACQPSLKRKQSEESTAPSSSSSSSSSSSGSSNSSSNSSSSSSNNSGSSSSSSSSSSSDILVELYFRAIENAGAVE